jgi:hypothetical protein
MHNLDTGEHSSPSRKPSGGFHLTSFVELKKWIIHHSEQWEKS